MAQMPKTTRRKPKRWLYPHATEREYERLLLVFADSIAAEIERQLPLLDLRQDALDDIPESSGWYERLRRWVVGIADVFRQPEKTIAGALSLLREAARFNQVQFHKVVRSVFSVDVFAHEPWLLDVMKQFEAENIRLIKSIPAQYLETLHGKIVAAVRAGLPHAKLADFIRETYALPKSRARLIARDQIGKLNGQLTMERQRGIGVTQYIWRTSRDERVRHTHREREGKVFDWDAPPKDGHPSEPIQCRCSAEGIYPDFADLKGIVYERHPL